MMILLLLLLLIIIIIMEQAQLVVVAITSVSYKNYGGSLNNPLLTLSWAAVVN
jgi:hypothetical protein